MRGMASAAIHQLSIVYGSMEGIAAPEEASAGMPRRQLTAAAEVRRDYEMAESLAAPESPAGPLERVLVYTASILFCLGCWALAWQGFQALIHK